MPYVDMEVAAIVNCSLSWEVNPFVSTTSAVGLVFFWGGEGAFTSV